MKFALSSPDERLREITLLQQKAKALEAEIAQRKEAEKALSQRERDNPPDARAGPGYEGGAPYELHLKTSITLS